VRSLGELKILSLASYFMLVFVPLLAGVWPAVRAGVNQYNYQALHSAERLESISAKITEVSEHLVDSGRNGTAQSQWQEGQAKLARLDESVDLLTLEVAMLTEALRPPAVSSPMLPWSWAAGFFAALFVVIGHLVYESRAPAPVRAESIDEFVQGRLENFSQNPTMGRVRDAVSFLRMRGIDGPENSETLTDQEKTEMIGDAAKEMYFWLASKEPVAALVSLASYSVGLVLILAVIGRQCYSVCQAAGWF